MCTGSLGDYLISIYCTIILEKVPTGGDRTRRYPDGVHHVRYAAQQVANQERGHVHAELGVEYMPLALELLEAPTVKELVAPNVDHA